MLLSANDVLRAGLEHAAHIPFWQQKSMSRKSKAQIFHDLFGSTPLDLSDMWFDLQQGDYNGASLTVKENTEKGFKMFMMAHFFLWVYPRNCRVLSRTFNICERYCRGKPLWNWIERIAALKAKKIKWDDSLASPDTEMFIASIDGIDCKTTEKKHPEYNLDTKMYSKKFNHGGVKYEIILSVNKDKCMPVSKVFKAGKPDMDVFRETSKEKVKEIQRHSKRHKMLIGDSKYRKGPNHADEKDMFAPPNSIDPKVLAAYKSRVRCRHESFNGRIKNFGMASGCFRGSIATHEIAFHAIVVIVQYQMDNGSPIFTSK